MVLVTGCGKKNDEDRCEVIPDTKGVSIDLQFESLDDSIHLLGSKTSLVGFLKRHPLIRDRFLGRAGYPNDSVFVNDLFKRIHNPFFDTLMMETGRVFGDKSDLKEQFREAFTNLKYYYPQFIPPKVQTMVTGLERDLLISDSVLVIGLDYYLGAGAKYRPDTYQYILRRYAPNYIVPSILLTYGIDPRYNRTDLGDRTVLADMISFGKAFYFTKRLLPCVPDSVLIGYSQDEIEGSRKNEGLIYVRLVENEVLYSTNHQTKQHYLDERPKTLEIGERCPGRIAQWVGWRIVNEYARQHPNQNLSEIMNITSADALFKESRYRPDRK